VRQISKQGNTVSRLFSHMQVTMQNRLLGEGNSTDPAAGLSLNSSIVHNYYATSSFGLGSIYWNPAKNLTLGAPPQEVRRKRSFRPLLM
jgi:hypothetical protein